MAVTGLSIPVCGEYAYTSSTGAVAYSNGFIADKAVEYSIEIETSDDNPDYQDNEIAENEYGTFKTGTVKLTIGDLMQDLSNKLLGTTVITGTASAPDIQVYDDTQQAPTLGFGIIEEHIKAGTKTYRAVMLHKVIFKVPSDSASTRGESVEWGHKELEGKIMRSDEVSTNYKHPWKSDAWFTTEADALDWLKGQLGVQ